MSQTVVEDDDSDIADRPRAEDEEEVIPFKYSITSYGRITQLTGSFSEFATGV